MKSNEINIKLIVLQRFIECHYEIWITLAHKKPMSLFPLGLEIPVPETNDESGWAKSTVAISFAEDGNVDIYQNGKELAGDLMSAFCFLDGAFQISTEGEVLIESHSILNHDGLNVLEFAPEASEWVKISDSQQFFGASQAKDIYPVQDRIIVSIQLEERAKSELSFEIFEDDSNHPKTSLMLQHDFDNIEKCFFNIFRDVFDSDGKYIPSFREKQGYCAYFEGESYIVSLRFKIGEESSTVDAFFQVGDQMTTKLDIPLPITSLDHVRIRQSYYREVPGNYIIENKLDKVKVSTQSDEQVAD